MQRRFFNSLTPKSKILVATVVVLLLVASSVSAAEEVNYGDLNDDGKVDVQDAVLVMQYVLDLVELDEDQLKAADVNEDGNIDVLDVVIIMQYILGMVESLPSDPIGEEEETDDPVEEEDGAEPIDEEEDTEDPIEEENDNDVVDDPDDVTNGATEDTSGTWSIEESFSGALTSDFTVSVQNLDGATHYELYVDDVLLGDRVTIDDYVRSVTIVFSNPEYMEVKFFSSSTAASPFAVASCSGDSGDKSGNLIFH